MAAILSLNHIFATRIIQNINQGSEAVAVPRDTTAS